MRRTALALSLAFIISGCAGLRPLKEELPPGPPLAAPASIRANASVEIKRNTLSLTGRANIIARSPGSFRIEVMGPFNQTAALLVSDGKNLYMLSNGEIEKHGWDEPGFPYSFRAGDIVSLLLGATPDTGLEAGTGYEAATDEAGCLKKLTRTKAGKNVLTAALDDYRNIEGAHIPFNISIADEKRDIRIRYRSVEVNPRIDDDIFTIDAISDDSLKEVD